MANRKPRAPADSLAGRVHAAAQRVGAEYQEVQPYRWYVWTPPGKVWACDPEVHVLMVFDYKYEDIFANQIASIDKGLVDCPVPGCEFCDRLDRYDEAERRKASMDSARL